MSRSAQPGAPLGSPLVSQLVAPPGSRPGSQLGSQQGSRLGSRQGAHSGVLAHLQPLLELLVVFLFVTTFLFQTTGIPSSSMVPTLRVGDMLLIDKQSYARGPAGLLPPSDIHRGDVAVFHYPVDPSVYVVKRVIALPGDRLRLHDGVVILNGQPLAEPYATHDPHDFSSFRDDFPSFRATDPNLDPLWWAQMRRIVHNGEIAVPAGEVFVLGDNRDNSDDSRYWGFVPLRNLVGRPLLVFFSPHGPLHAMRVVR